MDTIASGASGWGEMNVWEDGSFVQFLAPANASVLPTCHLICVKIGAFVSNDRWGICWDLPPSERLPDIVFSFFSIERGAAPAPLVKKMKLVPQTIPAT